MKLIYMVVTKGSPKDTRSGEKNRKHANDLVDISSQKLEVVLDDQHRLNQCLS